ncbi:sensor histidine kinase [Actinomadura sp. ATCC 31491]|uniref:Sensor histidine kinase n=1 Tax=Actinomadura luzonensis TaxID=2805427 RepID=A0ABT0FJV1_9ACTN|nr:sensor histidine kinase [Actinomadura luzonensis]MCK2212233.1 sensor histidine kinase [Actinomadura luzonensis]
MSATTTGADHGAPPRLVHHALVYGSDGHFVSVTAPFCQEGLAAGDKVLAVTTAANIALLRAALGRDADDVEFVEAAGWYDAPGRTLAAYDRYVQVHQDGRRRVRVIGEPVWQGRSAAEETEWIRYESALNAAFAGQPAWIVCPYDERVLPGRIVAEARRTHPALLTPGGVRPSDAYVEPESFTCDADALPLPPPPPDPLADFPFDGDLHLMRGLVRAAVAPLGMSEERVGLLLLAVNEVVSNAVEHGGGHGRLVVWAEGPVVVCDVTDPGRMERSLPGFRTPEPTATRGYGLWVVRRVCDLLEIRTGPAGTQIRLRLSRA